MRNIYFGAEQVDTPEACVYHAQKYTWFQSFSAKFQGTALLQKLKLLYGIKPDYTNTKVTMLL